MILDSGQSRTGQSRMYSRHSVDFSAFVWRMSVKRHVVMLVCRYSAIGDIDDCRYCCQYKDLPEQRLVSFDRKHTKRVNEP